jgi:hypothetical protein
MMQTLGYSFGKDSKIDSPLLNNSRLGVGKVGRNVFYVGGGEEDVDHLFFQCHLAKFV